MRDDPHADQPVISSGAELVDAAGVVIMLHGRGGSAGDILSLAEHLGQSSLAYLAPEASGNTWYPQSFLKPIEQNEPYLTSALAKVESVFELAINAGISAERVALLGFSQGACLASEFVARSPRRYGGLIAFSGGLIGPPSTEFDYPGDLQRTPAFVGCSDVDPHIPVDRVRESAEVLESMNAAVDLRIFPGMGHIINAEELEAAAAILQQIKSYS